MLGVMGLWLLSCVPLPTETQSEAPERAGQREPWPAKITLELRAGRVYYAAYMGGHEWRATFETVIIKDGDSTFLDQAEVKFYWMAKRTRPEVEEDGWITSEPIFPHGLNSIDGHWLDRQPAADPVWWMMAHVRLPSCGVERKLVGMCNFLEGVERPDRGWDFSRDMKYGICDRVLARLTID